MDRDFNIPLFTDRDFYQIFPNGIPDRPSFQPRPLYTYELRSLQAIIVNPALPKAIQNIFGNRPLSNTELNALTNIYRNHKIQDRYVEAVYNLIIHNLQNQVTLHYYQTNTPTNNR